MSTPAPGERVALYLAALEAGKAHSGCAASAGLDAPTDTVRRYAEARGWRVVAIYGDAANGSCAGRRGLEALIEDAQAGLFDLLAVPCLHVLADSAGDLVRFLERLARAGAGLVSLREDIDTTRPEGRMLWRLIATLAEMERTSARAGQTRGRARRRGTPTGRRVGRPRRSVDCHRARELRRQGHSFRQISQLMGVPATTLHAKLREFERQADA